LRTLSKSTAEKLIKYHWPGNVRQLQNEIKRIIVLGEDTDLINEMRSDKIEASPSPPIETLINRVSIPTELLSLDLKESMAHGSVSLKKIKKEARNRVDREMISYVLKKTRWNRGRAAKILDVSYKMLHSKIDELNIKPMI
jgi:DNA-binding NtrC family response regulator